MVMIGTGKATTQPTRGHRKRARRKGPRRKRRRKTHPRSGNRLPSRNQTKRKVRDHGSVLVLVPHHPALRHGGRLAHMALYEGRLGLPSARSVALRAQRRGGRNRDPHTAVLLAGAARDRVAVVCGTSLRRAEGHGSAVHRGPAGQITRCAASTTGSPARAPADAPAVQRRLALPPRLIGLVRSVTSALCNRT